MECRLRGRYQISRRVLLVKESAMNRRSVFKSPGVVVALSVAVLILVFGLFFGFGRILWIMASAGVILVGVGVYVPGRVPQPPCRVRQHRGTP